MTIKLLEISNRYETIVIFFRSRVIECTNLGKDDADQSIISIQSRVILTIVYPKKEEIMNLPKIAGPSRRKFLSSIMPACAVACVGCTSALALGKSRSADFRNALQEKVHPFDAEFPNKLTFRQVMEMRSRELIRLGKWMKKEMGPDTAIDFLKKYTSENWLERGKTQASQAADHSLRQYTQMFRNPDTWKNVLTMEIVEDTDTAFGLKVTECIWPSIFLPQEAGDLGNAFICHGDYAWAEGFNPKIKLVRTKTIMKGDTICNHRYIWQE